MTKNQVQLDLRILINGGNRCDVRFKDKHTFERVITLLRNNHLLPQKIPDNEVTIKDDRGNSYKRDQLVKQALNGLTGGQILIYFDKEVSKMKSSGLSIKESSSNASDKLVKLIRAFYQMMEERKFSQIERKMTINEGIIPFELSQFSKVYERLYVMYLFYKNGWGKLNKKQNQEIDQFKLKYSDEFINIQKERMESFSSSNSQNLRESELESNIQLWQKKYEAISKILFGRDQEVQEFKKMISDSEAKVKKIQKQVEYQKLRKDLQLHGYQEEIEKLKDQIRSLVKREEKKDLNMTKKNVRIVELQRRVKELEKELTQQTKQREMKQNIMEKLQQSVRITVQEKENLHSQFQKMKTQANELKAKNDSALDQKIKKKQSTHEKNIELNLLCRLMQCQQNQLTQLVSTMNKDINDVKFQMVYKWSNPEDVNQSAQSISKRVYQNQNIFFVCQTSEGKVLGGYSTIHFGPNGSIKNERLKPEAFLFQLQKEQLRVYKKKDEKSPITFDEQFLVFGDEDLTLDYSTRSIQSRFVKNISENELSYSDESPNLKRRRYFLSSSQATEIQIKWYYLMTC